MSTILTKNILGKNAIFLNFSNLKTLALGLAPMR